MFRLPLGWSVFLAAYFLLPALALAQRTVLPQRIVPCNGIDCKCQHLAELAQNIITGGIFIIIFLSAFIFAYAGWLYISNEALNEQARAKGMFLHVIFGLTLVLVAWLFVDTLMRETISGSFGTWNSLCQFLPGL